MSEPQAVNIAVRSVDELARVVHELLDHVTLRDAAEKDRLRALITGEEVSDADETGHERSEGPERGDEGTAGGSEPS